VIRGGIVALDVRVMLGSRSAADFELSLRAIPAGNDAVDQDARVAQQVRGFC